VAVQSRHLAQSRYKCRLGGASFTERAFKLGLWGWDARARGESGSALSGYNLLFRFRCLDVAARRRTFRVRQCSVGCLKAWMTKDVLVEIELVAVL
jgi:hypothetical protein